MRLPYLFWIKNNPPPCIRVIEWYRQHKNSHSKGEWKVGWK